MGCPFCKVPCNQEHCPHTITAKELDEAIGFTKSLIPNGNHAFYADRERILKHLEALYAHITKQQKE